LPLHSLGHLLALAVLRQGQFSAEERLAAAAGKGHSKDISSGCDKYPYPLGGSFSVHEHYVLALRVDGLGHAAYSYDFLGHALKLITPISRNGTVESLLGGRTWATDAHVLIVLASFPNRRNYLNSEQMAMVEAGHVLHNLSLVGTFLGLRGCLLGGASPTGLARFLDFTGERSLVNVIAIGMSSEQARK
jgi:SagB-type dehydrogenase family enzyme